MKALGIKETGMSVMQQVLIATKDGVEPVYMDPKTKMEIGGQGRDLKLEQYGHTVLNTGWVLFTRVFDGVRDAGFLRRK